jgi:Delta7-sterol 5-desaturase
MDELTGLRLWAAIVGVAAVGGLVLYFGYGSWLYLRYYVRRRDEAEAWKLQPKRWPSPKLHRWAIAVAAGNMMIGGLLSGTFAYFVLTRGFSALYLEVEDYGWAWTIASTVLMFFAIEAAAYYTHRFLHTRFMFKHVHQWHHRLVAPTPYATVTMHPVEFTMLQCATFLPVLVLPVHWVAFAGLLVYALVYNLMDHSGIRIKHRLPWHSSSSFHDDHHVCFHCNYGQHIAIFDRLHGTHRRHGRRYGKDVFGGRGAPASPGQADEPGTFVRY